jgi:hypothetical protein
MAAHAAKACPRPLAQGSRIDESTTDRRCAPGSNGFFFFPIPEKSRGKSSDAANARPRTRRVDRLSPAHSQVIGPQYRYVICEANQDS